MLREDMSRHYSKEHLRMVGAINDGKAHGLINFQLDSKQQTRKKMAQIQGYNVLEDDYECDTFKYN